MEDDKSKAGKVYLDDIGWALPSVAGPMAVVLLFTAVGHHGLDDDAWAAGSPMASDEHIEVSSTSASSSALYVRP